MTGSSIRAVDIPLHRLLKRQEIADLVESFRVLLPRPDLAVVGADGRLFAGTGAWPRGEVTALLARAGDGQVQRGGGLLLLPLLVGSQLAGGLVTHDGGAEAVLRPLGHSLALLLAQAMERRDLVRETLDRYREVNLLYNIAETIGSLLDAEEITHLLLGEAVRIIGAEVGVVLLPPASPEEGETLKISASLPRERGEAISEMWWDMISQVYRSGRPAIITDLPAPSIPTALPTPSRATRPTGLPRDGGDRAGAGPMVCVPLKTQEKVLGVILLGRVAGGRVFTAGDEKLLMALANQAAIAIERARLHREEVQRQRLEEELAIGRRIQLSLLPGACPEVEGWQFAAIYEPARQVGGDLYDFLELPGEPRRLGLLIADVTDKGVPAALFMAFSRTIIRTESMGGGRLSPAEALTRANWSIVRDVPADSRLFLSAFYATLDVHSGRLAYANGGHAWPLWVRAATGEVRELSARGMLLGIYPDIELEELEIEVAPGDVLVFYTDGVTEAKDAQGRMFEEERLFRVAAANLEASAQQMAGSIVEAVRAFAGGTPPSDDLTLFVVKRK